MVAVNGLRTDALTNVVDELKIAVSTSPNREYDSEVSVAVREGVFDH